MTDLDHHRSHVKAPASGGHRGTCRCRTSEHSCRHCRCRISGGRIVAAGGEGTCRTCSGGCCGGGGAICPRPRDGCLLRLRLAWLLGSSHRSVPQTVRIPDFRTTTRRNEAKGDLIRREEKLSVKSM